MPASVTTLTTLLQVIAGHGGAGGGGRLCGAGGRLDRRQRGHHGWCWAICCAHMLFRPRWRSTWPSRSSMLRDSYPLMINQLLATLFFKVAVLLLEWLVKDPRVLGWYSTAYKYIDAVGIIPAYFTMAIFPADVALCRHRQRFALARLSPVHQAAADRGHARGAPGLGALARADHRAGRLAIPAPCGQHPAGDDLVHALWLYQLGHPVRAHRAGPAALSHPRLCHRPGV